MYVSWNSLMKWVVKKDYCSHSKFSKKLFCLLKSHSEMGKTWKTIFKALIWVQYSREILLYYVYATLCCFAGFCQQKKYALENPFLSYPIKTLPRKIARYSLKKLQIPVVNTIKNEHKVSKLIVTLSIKILRLSSLLFDRKRRCRNCVDHLWLTHSHH